MKLITKSRKEINLKRECCDIQSKGERREQQDWVSVRRLNVPAIQADVNFPRGRSLYDVKERGLPIWLLMLDQVQSPFGACNF